jgi:hypothetical protein
MTLLEAKQALARKLDISLTDIANNDLFTEADLGDFVQAGVNVAWDYKPWTFSEGTRSTTAADQDYYSYPQEFEDESISRVTVGGKTYGKRNFDDYNAYLAEWPSDTNYLFSDHGRFYFLNRNAYAVGDTITITGKLRAPVLSADADLLPFSPDTDNYESSGNRAVIHFAFAEALGSEKLKNYAQAEAERKTGFRILDLLWKPMGQRRANEQSLDRPFFTALPDMFGRGNRTGCPIANFDLF